eukprot:scpid92024/ scgid33044/ 
MLRNSPDLLMWCGSAVASRATTRQIRISWGEMVTRITLTCLFKQPRKSFIRNVTACPGPLLELKKLGPDNTGRKTKSTLNQLLTGHSSLLNEYLHRISARPSCTRLRMVCRDSAENADHLLLKLCPFRKSSRDLSNLAVFTDVREAILSEPCLVVQFLQLEGLL